jgi:uncharacterized protein (UPF0147 family)
MNNEIEDILFLLEELLEDSTIPRNVKNILSDVKNKVENHSEDIVQLSEAIYSLQDVSEDVNLPLNAKSDIWLLQSKIEKIKESVK